MIQYLITALIDIVVAIIAVSKRRDGAAMALAGLAISACLWSVELYLLTVIDDLDLLYPLYHLTRAGLFFIPSAMALFVWYLIGHRSKVFLFLVVVPGLIASAVLGILNNTILPSELIVAENGYTSAVDNLYLCFVGTFIYCVIGAIIYCGLKYKKAAVREKQKIKWVLITLFVAFLFGLSSLYLWSFSFYLSKLSGPLTNVLFLTSLLYATIRHDLMDIRLAMGIGLARVILIASFAWIFFSLNSAFTADSMGGTITLLVFFVLVLEAYPKMVKWLTPGTRKIFDINRIDFDKLSLEAKMELDRCMTHIDLHHIVDKILTHRLNIESFEFYLADINGDSDEQQFVSLTNKKELIVLSNDLIGQVEKHADTALLLLDELPKNLQSVFDKNDAIACSYIDVDYNCKGLLLLSKSPYAEYFRYDDIKMLEWLNGELAKSLKRIKEVSIFEEELNEAKKKLSVLSLMGHYHHDIKAPFSVIDGVVSHELYDKEKQREIILDQVALGSKLITTMAGLLKGKRHRNVGPVSINAIIEDCLLIFNHALASSHIDVSQDAVVMGDADDLKILFINIIKNACEAAKEGKITIRVKAWREPTAVHISIADNGIGIDSADLNTILESGKTSKEHGSGIGLQAIKRIADEHEAVIDITSRKGEGTDVTLTFPLSA